MSSKREMVESPVDQGTDEEVPYELTTTVWGSSPTVLACQLFDAEGVDVSATNLSGSSSVVGDVITSPLVLSLTKGKVYMLRVRFSFAGVGGKYSAKCYIRGED